jgi:hypothetical protein
VLLAILIVLFVVSLPGFGIETRRFTQYAAWAGPVFLVLTILVFAGAAGGLATGRSRPRLSASLATLAAASAIVATLLDFSLVGGPPAPPGPFVLGIVTLAVSVLILVVAGWVLRAASAESTPAAIERPTTTPPTAPPAP